MVSVMETIIAITTQNQPKPPKIKQMKRSIPGALIGKKMTRLGSNDILIIMRNFGRMAINYIFPGAWRAS